MNSTQASSILVAGSANLDFVVRAPHIPAPGETVLGREFRTYPGGKGANQAVAAARAGGAVTALLAAFGEDTFAAPIEASLRAAGVALHAVRFADTPTGTAFICVSDAAENAITVAPGANARLEPTHLPVLTGVSHLLLQLEIPLASVSAYAAAARTARVSVVLNAAPAQALPAALLSSIDLLIVNEGEFAALTGSHGTLDERLQQLPVPTVIVTLGERGCIAKTPAGRLQQPGFAVQAVDTTAAGDTFCGVLVAALSRGETLAGALRRASAAAALACTRHGAQDSIPDASAVDALLAASSSTINP
ncbi:ribokinase [Aquincola sp. S2]|uniref:Ribokinase n=1 Tax=Pseudaquabacterium terrae TaxID=2732868 RepID=A0ABX2EBU3_9BURK|nr:ribokinase [Aquabacterium terrae]NRF65817.1 ribokinase [Aquabacterium terrae]